jgi:hypothetical protein
MSTLRRIVRLIACPREEWDAIAREPTSVDFLIRRYILPLSLLAPIATVIGMKTFDRSWDPDKGYLVLPEHIFAAGATTLLATIGSIFALAAIFRALAPLYDGPRDYGASLTVATYGAVPLLVAGATLVMPIMIIVSMVALCHTLFLFWLGARTVLNVRQENLAEFVGIALVLLGGVSTLAGATASRLGLF